jgi:hypothetical protein
MNLHPLISLKKLARPISDLNWDFRNEQTHGIPYKKKYCSGRSSEGAHKLFKSSSQQ